MALIEEANTEAERGIAEGTEILSRNADESIHE